MIESFRRQQFVQHFYFLPGFSLWRLVKRFGVRVLRVASSCKRVEKTCSKGKPDDTCRLSIPLINLCATMLFKYYVRINSEQRVRS